MTFLWILLGIVYIACWLFLGLATFRKGHYWMFWIGFFLPILWIVGALIAPTQRAAARAAASGGRRRMVAKATRILARLRRVRTTQPQRAIEDRDVFCDHA